MSKNLRLLIILLIAMGTFSYFSSKKYLKNEEGQIAYTKNSANDQHSHISLTKKREIFKKGKIKLNTSHPTLNINEKEINQSPPSLKSHGPAIFAKIKSRYIKEKLNQLHDLFNLNDEEYKSLNNIYENFWANSLSETNRNEPKDELIKVLGKERYLEYLNYQKNLNKIEEDKRKLNTVKLIVKKLSLSKQQELELRKLLNNTDSLSNKSEVDKKIYKILDDKQQKLYQSTFVRDKKHNSINPFLR